MLLFSWFKHKSNAIWFILKTRKKKKTFCQGVRKMNYLCYTTFLVKKMYLVLRMFTDVAHLKEGLVARNMTNLLVCWELLHAEVSHTYRRYQSIVCSAQMFCALNSLSLSFRLSRQNKLGSIWMPASAAFFHGRYFTDCTLQLESSNSSNNLVFFE